MVYLDLLQDTEKPYRWGMPQSYCRSNGPIVQYVQTLVDQIDPSKKLLIPACDGIAHRDDNEEITQCPTWRTDYGYNSQVIQEIEENHPDIIGVLCSRNRADARYVYLPLDDDTFVNGLRGIPLVPWEQKQSIAFWRGGTSGYPFVRKHLVERVLSNTNFDARFVGHYGDRGLPKEYFADSVAFDKYVQHKYILVIDGAVISSSHQWVFGSGSVPILITHPANNFWFKHHLKPWHNYVPVSYSLTELEPTIQWLQEHDNEARCIAENAKKLADSIFTPEYQKSYITQSVESVLKL